MTHRKKVTLWVIGALIVFAALVFTCADIVVSRFVQREVNKSLSNLPIPGCEASCGNVQVFLFAGMAEVEDLRFSFRGEPLHKRDTIHPGFALALERLRVGHIFYTPLLTRSLLVDRILAEQPSIELWLDEKHPEKSFPEMRDDGMKRLLEVINRIALNELRIDNASLKFHSLSSKLDVMADSCSFAAHDFVYADSVFSYCDSIYKVQLGHISLLTPDGLIRIDTRDIAQRDAGDLTIGKTRINHTVAKKSLGDRVKEPVTWIDMHIANVRLAAFNPIRKAMAQDYTLDNIVAVVSQANIFRDDRFKPKHPYRMPQEELMDMPVQLAIKNIDARINNMNIEVAIADDNIGKLKMHDAHATIADFTNKRNKTMRIEAKCPIEQGVADVNLAFTMNKNCDFKTKMHAAGVDGQFINTLLRPITGITLGFELDTLDALYTGNRTNAEGICRLLYHGLQVQVHKEDKIPFKAITANADFINSAAKNLLPKSNPSTVDIHPRAYKVEAKRDEMMFFPIYMMMPIINGAVKTFLPGLFVHCEVHHPDFETAQAK